MSNEQFKKSQRSIRKHLIAGLAVVLLLAGGLGGWGSTVPISGALIAPGQVVVESNVKKVSTRPAAWSARCACATAIW